MEETLNIKENEENSNYNDFVKFMNVSQCADISNNQRKTIKFEEELQFLEEWLATSCFDGACTKVTTADGESMNVEDNIVRIFRHLGVS